MWQQQNQNSVAGIRGRTSTMILTQDFPARSEALRQAEDLIRQANPRSRVYIRCRQTICTTASVMRSVHSAAVSAAKLCGERERIGSSPARSISLGKEVVSISFLSRLQCGDAGVRGRAAAHQPALRRRPDVPAARRKDVLRLAWPRQAGAQSPSKSQQRAHISAAVAAVALDLQCLAAEAPLGVSTRGRGRSQKAISM